MNRRYEPLHSRYTKLQNSCHVARERHLLRGLSFVSASASLLACLRAFEVRIRPLDELKVKLLGLRLHIDTLGALDRLT